jgi:hypothetical protein
METFTPDMALKRIQEYTEQIQQQEREKAAQARITEEAAYAKLNNDVQYMIAAITNHICKFNKQQALLDYTIYIDSYDYGESAYTTGTIANEYIVRNKLYKIQIHKSMYDWEHASFTHWGRSYNAVYWRIIYNKDDPQNIIQRKMHVYNAIMRYFETNGFHVTEARTLSCNNKKKTTIIKGLHIHIPEHIDNTTTATIPVATSVSWWNPRSWFVSANATQAAVVVPASAPDESVVVAATAVVDLSGCTNADAL